MGIRHTNAYANSCSAARALDAARLGDVEGFVPSIKTEGQRLPFRLEPPV